MHTPVQIHLTHFPRYTHPLKLLHDSYGETSRGSGATPQRPVPYKTLLYSTLWLYDRLALPDSCVFLANKSPSQYSVIR